MDKEEFRLLVYSKGFNNDLTQKLLRIADSSIMTEDLLELIHELNVLVDEGSSNDVESCSDCTITEEERDEAVEERDEAVKKFEGFKKDVIDLVINFEDLVGRKPIGSLEKKPELKTEPTGKTGIVTTVPQYLLHVKCECGNELFIDSKQPGWQVDLRSGLDFTCPCGKVLSVPIQQLCKGCELNPKNPCGSCDRPLCPECEVDDPHNPPCNTCNGERPRIEK